MASAVRTWPFRVYSFPSKIVLARFDDPSAELELENLRTAVPILLLGDVPPKPAYALPFAGTTPMDTFQNGHGIGSGEVREPYRYFRSVAP